MWSFLTVWLGSPKCKLTSLLPMNDFIHFKALIFFYSNTLLKTCNTPRGSEIGLLQKVERGLLLKDISEMQRLLTWLPYLGLVGK